MSEQCSGVGGQFVLGGEISSGGGKRGLLKNKATEIKKENNAKNVLFSMKSHCLRVVKCALGAERGQEQILCE